jgi:lysophospholipase L1-like esterase
MPKTRRIPTGPFKRLVVLGESTVQGGPWLQGESERWADILHRLLQEAQEQPLQYFNAGIGGSVISPRSPGYWASAKPSAAERLQEQVIARRPDLLVIAYGLNDMRAGMPLREFREELEALIGRTRAKLSPLIILVSVYYITAYRYYQPFDRGSRAATVRYNAVLRGVARARGCAFADAWAPEGECEWVVHPDTVHANKIGNLLIAHKVLEAIVHAAPGIARNVHRRDARTEWTRQCSRWKTHRTEKS